MCVCVCYLDIIYIFNFIIIKHFFWVLSFKRSKATYSLNCNQSDVQYMNTWAWDEASAWTSVFNVRCSSQVSEILWSSSRMRFPGSASVSSAAFCSLLPAFWVYCWYLEESESSRENLWKDSSVTFPGKQLILWAVEIYK